MAFRTISRSDNRALACPLLHKRRSEGKGEEEGAGRQAWRRSHPLRVLDPTDVGRMSYEPLRRNLRTWLDIGRENGSLPYTMVGVFIHEEIHGL